MSVVVVIKLATVGKTLEIGNDDAVTFSVTDGALLLYDRDASGLLRLSRAFAPGQWERAWVEAEG